MKLPRHCLDMAQSRASTRLPSACLPPPDPGQASPGCPSASCCPAHPAQADLCCPLPGTPPAAAQGSPLCPHPDGCMLWTGLPLLMWRAHNTDLPLHGLSLGWPRLRSPSARAGWQARAHVAPGCVLGLPEQGSSSRSWASPLAECQAQGQLAGRLRRSQTLLSSQRQILT